MIHEFPEFVRGNPLQHKTVATRVEGTLVSFSVVLYGKDLKKNLDRNWSLKPFQHPNDRKNDQERATRVSFVCTAFGVAEWYAPVPDFNGTIINPLQLSTSIDLGDVRIRRGIRADGVTLSQGAGYLVSLGGCALVVATDGVAFRTAHAGLRSVFRYDESKYVGLIERLAESFPVPRRVHVWIFWSIRPKRFLHPPTGLYAQKNQTLLRALREAGYGECIDEHSGIDLPTLIRMQVERMEMFCAPPDVHTYLPYGGYDTRSPAPYNEYRNLAVAILNSVES